MRVSIFIASKSHTSRPWLINKFIFAPSLCFVQPQHAFHVVYNDRGHKGEIPSLWAAPSSHITQIKDMQSPTGGFTPTVLLLDLWCRREERYWTRGCFKMAPSIRALESGDFARPCARMYATEARNQSRSRGGEWTILTWRAITLHPLIDVWSLPCKYHFSSRGYSFSFSWPGFDTLRRVYLHTESNRRTLITDAKSLRSFGQDGRAAANRSPGPSLTPRCLKCRPPRISIQLIWYRDSSTWPLPRHHSNIL